MTTGPIDISQLRSAVQAIEQRGLEAFDPDHPPLATDWAVLHRQVLHEWFAPAGPPLCLLADLGWRAIGRGYGFWVGRACWPHPQTLIVGADRRTLERSFFIDPTDAQRLWAIDLVLRSNAASVVVADVNGLDLAATRRLQLAAESGRALALVTRSMRELGVPSSAAYRWLVQPIVSPTDQPRWEVKLLRCKDARSAIQTGWTGQLEYRDGQGLVCLPAGLADPVATATRRTG